MPVKYNDAPEWPTLNCVGTVRVATKDGEFEAYQKPDKEDGSKGNLIIAVEFKADPATNGPDLKKWFWFDAEQFNSNGDGAKISEYAQRSFDSFFMNASGFAVCEGLTGDVSWIKRLEEFYNQQDGSTDVQAIAREVASRIDGQLIGYQAVQKREETGEVDSEGKKVRVRVKKYELGDRFFDGNNLKRVPKGKNVQNSWES